MTKVHVARGLRGIQWITMLRRYVCMCSESASAAFGTLHDESYDVRYIFRVPPKGHPMYTLTNIEREPYIHSPKTVI